MGERIKEMEKMYKYSRSNFTHLCSRFEVFNYILALKKKFKHKNKQYFIIPLFTYVNCINLNILFL